MASHRRSSIPDPPTIREHPVPNPKSPTATEPPQDAMERATVVFRARDPPKRAHAASGMLRGETLWSSAPERASKQLRNATPSRFGLGTRQSERMPRAASCRERLYGALLHREGAKPPQTGGTMCLRSTS